MARATRRKSAATKAETPDAGATPFQKFINAAVDAHLKRRDNYVWVMEKELTTSVITHDDLFKTQIIENRSELIYAGLYQGKRGSLILKFTPADSRPYKTVEIPEEKLFQAIPSIEPHMINALNVPPAEGYTWESARAVAFNQFEADVQRAEAEKAEKAEAKKQSDIEATMGRYAKDPLWGMFS